MKGIGAASAERLGAGGIATVGDLACLPVEEVAELLSVGPDRATVIHKAARLLDEAYGLCGVEGVDRELAVLLVRAGVRRRGELAAADPAALAKQLRQVAEEHPPSVDLALTAASLRVVVAAAGRGRS